MAVLDTAIATKKMPASSAGMMRKFGSVVGKAPQLRSAF
jgi:hypothetical protein